LGCCFQYRAGESLEQGKKGKHGQNGKKTSPKEKPKTEKKGGGLGGRGEQERLGVTRGGEAKGKIQRHRLMAPGKSGKARGSGERGGGGGGGGWVSVERHVFQ